MGSAITSTCYYIRKVLHLWAVTIAIKLERGLIRHVHSWRLGGTGICLKNLRTVRYRFDPLFPALNVLNGFFILGYVIFNWLQIAPQS